MIQRLNSSPELQKQPVGASVVIQNQGGRHSRKWDRTGQIVEVLPNHQYCVKMDGLGQITLSNRQFLREYSKLKTSTIIPSAVQPEFSATQSDTDELVPGTQPLNPTPTEQTSTHPTELSNQADPPGSSMPRALKCLASCNKPGLCEQPLNPRRRQEQSH